MGAIVKSKAETAARVALSVVLAWSLCGLPGTAFADDDAEPDAADSVETAEDAEGSGSSEAADGDASPSGSAQSSSVQYGLHADAAQAVHSNGAVLQTTAEGACGVYAEKGSTIIANMLDVKTQGTGAAAVATSPEGGSVSIANSTLSTGGADAPLFVSAGTVEADNVTGAAAQSQIARVRDSGALAIVGSTLTSSATKAASDESVAGAVTLYRESENDATTTPSKVALFQADGSSMKSALESGAFFHLANTSATIVLSNCDIDFDAEKVKLLVAAGSDATSGLVSTTKSEASTFGTQGKNGVTATFTAIDQDLNGDIEVDSISSVGFYLLEGSKWTGTSNITSNNAGTALSDNIVVNIDATSRWIVTENATVSKLNIEKGGALVDEKGKAVTIVDADGNKLVDGASDIEVAVTDDFSTTVKTSTVNELQPSAIDRAAFDEEFGTSTAFGTNGADAELSDAERAAELQAIITAWFQNL